MSIKELKAKLEAAPRTIQSEFMVAMLTREMYGASGAMLDIPDEVKADILTKALSILRADTQIELVNSLIKEEKSLDLRARMCLAAGATAIAKRSNNICNSLELLIEVYWPVQAA